MPREENLLKEEAEEIVAQLEDEDDVYDPRIVTGMGVYVKAQFDTGNLIGIIEIHDTGDVDFNKSIEENLLA